jgi:3-polyprenyl-4-hydroxybenzoate decarboxylase
MREMGLSASLARRLIETELEKAAPSTSFYWESDEVEDLLDLLVDVMANLIEANNKKITRDWQDELNRMARGM